MEGVTLYVCIKPGKGRGKFRGPTDCNDVARKSKARATAEGSSGGKAGRIDLDVHLVATIPASCASRQAQGASLIFRLRRRSALVACAIGGALLLAGCTGTTSENLTLPEKTIDQWVNPLDRFVPKNAIAGSYAELLLNSKCMRAAGFEWNPPWRDVNADWGPSWNEVERRLFNVPLATQYGYHEAPSDFQRPNPQWEAFMATENNHNSPDEQDALGVCIAGTRTQLEYPESDINRAMTHIATATDDASAEPKVVEAAKKWRECMKPFEEYDLPETPDRMPTRGIMQKFGVSNVPGDGARAGNTPSPEELKLAIADAKCRATSGHDRAFYDAEWDASVALYRDDADALERTRSALKRYEERVKVAISENAPSP